MGVDRPRLVMTPVALMPSSKAAEGAGFKGACERWFGVAHGTSGAWQELGSLHTGGEGHGFIEGKIDAAQSLARSDSPRNAETAGTA